jgi:hypothetical protein
MKIGCVVLAAFALTGCGDDAANPEDVTGRWAGTVGTDSAYLELSQDGLVVQGEACERPGLDCYSLLGATFIDGQLTGSYSWFESDGSGYTTFVSLMIDEGGSEFSGSYTSTECSCRLDARLSRQ